MENPWKKIPSADYENHMATIGQAQVLSELTKHCLNKYKPKSFALVGCATGNGLEHIKHNVTKNVYAIDINPYYLEKVKERFGNRIENLQICVADIQNDKVKIKNVDLVFIGLVLEYVEPEKALEKIVGMLSNKGVLSIIIQKNRKASFVSKTKYKSLEKLAGISTLVDDEKIDRLIKSKNMELIERSEIELTVSKSFIYLEYKVIEISEL